MAAIPSTLILAGCGSSPSASFTGEWEAVRDTLGDTIVVHTVSGSVWGEAATLVPELRIGVLDGEPEYMFGGLRALAVAPDGSIYVFDHQIPALRKYGRDGTYIKTFGREGRGPGEYKQPDFGALAVMPDGRVLLRDPGNGRINVYSSTGEPLDNWRIAGAYLSSTALVVGPDARVYKYIFGNQQAMEVFSPDGVILDTIFAPEWDHETPRLSAVGPDGGSLARRRVPFSPQVHWAFSPLGYAVGGLSTEYRIDLFRPDGTVLRIERVYKPVPVTAGEREYNKWQNTRAMRRINPSWRWNGPGIPDTKPPFRDIAVGRDGSIWVRISLPGEPVPEKRSAAAGPDEEADDAPPAWREPMAFDVFEPDGRYLGRVQVPDRFSTYPPPVYGTERVWAVVRDELGVQYVVRFRIQQEPDRT